MAKLATRISKRQRSDSVLRCEPGILAFVLCACGGVSNSVERAAGDSAAPTRASNPDPADKTPADAAPHKDTLQPASTAQGNAAAVPDPPPTARVAYGEASLKLAPTRIKVGECALLSVFVQTEPGNDGMLLEAPGGRLVFKQTARWKPPIREDEATLRGDERRYEVCADKPGVIPIKVSWVNETSPSGYEFWDEVKLHVAQ